LNCSDYFDGMFGIRFIWTDDNFSKNDNDNYLDLMLE